MFGRTSPQASHLASAQTPVAARQTLFEVFDVSSRHYSWSTRPWPERSLRVRIEFGLAEQCRTVASLDLSFCDALLSKMVRSES